MHKGNPQNLKGLVGNKCHVDCSNRGICDYNTGRCQCFDDHYGDNCSLVRRSNWKK